MADALPSIRVARPPHGPLPPLGGFWVYTGTGALGGGGRVWRRWQALVYERAEPLPEPACD